MAEIGALPWNGLTVVSTFSGCGGSSLGYRMAGYRVAWASEFVPAARQTYRANFPGTIVDERDIRDVDAIDVLDALGMGAGEIDVLDGSPPCASFSTAGRRHKLWGKEKAYSGTVQRTDDLFFEFARLLGGLRPKAFVAENVAGLIKGAAKGYFLAILAELKAQGYRVEARLLDAQWLGVPQDRKRLIFVGVREDLGLAPAFPRPRPYRYSIRDAIPDVGSITLHHPTSGFPDKRVPHTVSGPSPTITAGGISAFTRHAYWLNPIEPESDISRYAIGAEWDRLRPGEQSGKYFSLVRPHPDRPCPTVTQTAGNPSAAGVTHPTQKRKFSIAELKRICGFPDDFQVTGSYGQQWERLGRAVPPVMMAAIAATIRDEVLSRCKPS